MVEYTYDSWGKPISVTGTLATTLGANQPFRYRGYVYDTDTGMYYLQSRYYNPNICRFISADVLLSTGQGVIGNNSFAYCLNSPSVHYDPKGTWGHNTSDKTNVNDGGTGLFGGSGWGIRINWADWFGFSNSHSCSYNSGTSKAPDYDLSLSNGVYERIDGQGSLLSRAYYDDFGYQYLRFDYQGHTHNRCENHIHMRGFNSNGYRNMNIVFNSDWIEID